MPQVVSTRGGLLLEPMQLEIMQLGDSNNIQYTVCTRGSASVYIYWLLLFV